MCAWVLPAVDMGAWRTVAERVKPRPRQARDVDPNTQGTSVAVPPHMLTAHGNAKGRFCGPMPPMRSGRDGLAKAWDHGWPRLEAGAQIGTMPRRRLASAGLRAKVGSTLGPWRGASTGR